eukprot:TRINITY_DN6679_c0_g3_i1.p1 TRINITY_DN6679_c0_g3~~TRINITY_DN6679_c0_g3_i1.p1  ORF type:complete len:638 (+),score=133.58 TRINITY_DN6679_c0_g3_i1:77-1990(+)
MAEAKVEICCGCRALTGCGQHDCDEGLLAAQERMFSSDRPPEKAVFASQNRGDIVAWGARSELVRVEQGRLEWFVDGYWMGFITRIELTPKGSRAYVVDASGRGAWTFGVMPACGVAEVYGRDDDDVLYATAELARRAGIHQRLVGKDDWDTSSVATSASAAFSLTAPSPPHTVLGSGEESESDDTGSLRSYGSSSPSASSSHGLFLLRDRERDRLAGSQNELTGSLRTAPARSTSSSSPRPTDRFLPGSPPTACGQRHLARFCRHFPNDPVAPLYLKTLREQGQPLSGSGSGSRSASPGSSILLGAPAAKTAPKGFTTRLRRLFGGKGDRQAPKVYNTTCEPPGAAAVSKANRKGETVGWTLQCALALCKLDGGLELYCNDEWCYSVFGVALGERETESDTAPLIPAHSRPYLRLRPCASARERRYRDQTFEDDYPTCDFEENPATYTALVPLGMAGSSATLHPILCRIEALARRARMPSDITSVHTAVETAFRGHYASRTAAVHNRTHHIGRDPSMQALITSSPTSTVLPSMHLWPLSSAGSTAPPSGPLQPLTSLPTADQLKQSIPDHPPPPPPPAPSSVPEGTTCVVCLEGKRNCVFFPCRHLCACIECAGEEELIKCPLCREPILHKVEVWA